MTLRSRSVRIDADRCRGHTNCMRVCPTDALRVRHGKAELLPGRCIDCGQCLRACPAGAITPRVDSFTDLNRFRHTVAIPSPALFSQFGRDVTPQQIVAALQQAGFSEVVEPSAAIEAVLLELRRVLREESGRRPLISPFCPTAVRLIQIRYPDLVELIAPIESPQELLAAAVREHRAKILGLRREQIGIIYITSCAAKMVGLGLQTRLQPSHLDGAVAVSHIYGHLRSALAGKESTNAGPTTSGSAFGSTESRNGMTGAGLGWAVLGGQGASQDLENALAVGGLQNVIRTLDDLENGKLRDVAYIECRSCPDGCVDGCLMIENPYEARSKLMRMIRRRGTDLDEDRPGVREFLARPDLRAKPVVPRPQQSLDPDMARALEKMRRLEELHARLPQINCGACGAPTCRAFAEDVVQDRLEEDDCAFLLQGRLWRTVSELKSIVDKLPPAQTRTPEVGP